MAPKVIKLIVVSDDETADRIAAIAEVPIKERSASDENFTFTDVDGRSFKLHYVLSEEV